MLLAACEPVQSIRLYKERSVDSYWQTFWACMAYRKIKDDGEAEVIMSDLEHLWSNYPKGNVVLCACVGVLCEYNWNVKLCKPIIINHIKNNVELSEYLQDFLHSLLSLVGIEKEDNGKYDFYKKYFLSDTAYQSVQHPAPIAPVTAAPNASVASVVDRVISSFQGSEEDKPSTLLKLLSIFMPIIGFVLFFVYKDRKPITAKSCSKMAWIGLGIRVLLWLLDELFWIFD